MLGELRTSHTHFYTARGPEYFQICGIFWPFLEPELKPFLGGADVSYLWPFLASPFSFTMTDREGKETMHEEAWTKPVCLLVNGEVRTGKEL